MHLFIYFGRYIGRRVSIKTDSVEGARKVATRMKPLVTISRVYVSEFDSFNNFYAFLIV